MYNKKSYKKNILLLFFKYFLSIFATYYCKCFKNMEKIEWVPVLYNGVETNVEVTKCGRVRRLKKDWVNYKTSAKLGEIDFDKLLITIDGYRQVGIQIKYLKKKTIRIHQLVASAFLGYKFEGHKLVVDHIDSNKLNNHIDNLRIITQRENVSKEKAIKSGLPVGVCFCKRTKKYLSSITINKKQIHLGYFSTPEEASNAYQNKLKTI